ncbi:MAG: outer membrane lipoprotein LolB [Legionellales bacterium RIFCSPHIGHO2_12_FULL_35_11]|nr:MAG: outer membrane lipoprotein LolB [Legionellales bacterium RIFCSPHIGHO2_12_FULL_35_11]
MQNLKNYLLAAIICTVIACSPSRLPESTDTTKLQTEELAKFEENKAKKIKPNTPPSSFNLSGAMAVNHKGKGWNASLNWSQSSPNNYSIRLSGPLGGKTIIIDRKNSVITYRDGRKTIKSFNEEDLLKKETKVSIPVNNLYYWVRGVAAPINIQSINRNPNGQITSLQQSGFYITYAQYMTDSHCNVLPKKVQVQGNGVKIKLVVRSWG